VRRRDPRSGARAQPASRGRPPLCARRPASRTAAAAGIGLVLLVVGCSAGGPGPAPHSGGSGTAHPVTAAGSAAGTAGPSGSPAAGTLSLQVTPAPYQLPSGLAR
jgi:hypothetical protein